MNSKVPSTVFFPNLNGLRFVAASLVMIGHTQDWKSFYGLNSVASVPFFSKIGSLGVTLFFVLSGFLITYLLLAEKSTYGTINIKKFYLRRVLRIWPLYYLILIIGLFILSKVAFFVLPGAPKSLQEHYHLQILLFLILPNISQVAFTFVPYVAQTWSIGVEEQFYFIWPIILKHFKNHLQILIFIISILSEKKNRGGRSRPIFIA